MHYDCSPPHTPLWRRVLSPPTTRLGWYSLGFVGAVVLLLFALGTAVGALNAAGLPNLAGYPWLIATVLFVLGAPALAAVATGLLALIRRRAFDSGPRFDFPIISSL